MSKEHLKVKMIEALQKSKGQVYASCYTVGIAPKTHYEWLQTDADYKAEVEAIKERAIDHVEGKLMSLIDEGDTAATVFYLKTQGKRRGYIETEKKEINGKMDVATSVDITKLPEQELKEIADKLQGISRAK